MNSESYRFHADLKQTRYRHCLTIQAFLLAGVGLILRSNTGQSQAIPSEDFVWTTVVALSLFGAYSAHQFKKMNFGAYRWKRFHLARACRLELKEAEKMPKTFRLLVKKFYIEDENTEIDNAFLDQFCPDNANLGIDSATRRENAILVWIKILWFSLLMYSLTRVVDPLLALWFRMSNLVG